MAKRAHKILGIELRPGVNMARVADPVGRVDRVGLDWSGLSAGQQAALALQNKAKRMLGQSATA